MAYNQNNKTQENVNSRGIQFYNCDVEPGSTLIVGYWNSCISLKIHPAKPQATRTKTSVYDYSSSMSIAIPTAIAQNIIDKYYDTIKPAIEADEEATVGIPVGPATALILSTGKKRFDGLQPYIKICKKINEKFIAEETMEYLFNASRFIIDYDGNGITDPHNSKWNCGNELKNFIIALEEFVKYLSGAAYHADKHFNHRFKGETFTLFKGIADKIGVPFYDAPVNGNSNNDVFSKATERVDDISVNQVDNIEDIFG